MIAALVNAGRILGRASLDRDGDARLRFYRPQPMSRGDRLGHSWREGKLKFPGLASDFAAMIRAALALYEATGQRTYLDRALDLAAAHSTAIMPMPNRDLLSHRRRRRRARDPPGRDRRRGDAQPQCGRRAKSIRLAVLAGDDAWRQKADRLIAAIAPSAAENLYMHMALLNAIDLRLRAARDRGDAGRGRVPMHSSPRRAKLPPLDRIVLHAVRGRAAGDAPGAR